MAEKLVHYTCEICGESLELSQDKLSAKCKFCGTEYYFKQDNSEALILALNRANLDRLRCDFYDAIKGYKVILNEHPDNAEANWGLVLSIYGMEYVRDYRTGQYIPTCHRAVEESILKHPNYLQALKNAVPEQVQIFEEKAKQIEKLQKAIKFKMQDEEEFEVFISFKSTDANGNPTKDRAIARRIRDELEKRGIKTFFSDVTLKGRLGDEFEPIIYKALNTCKAFILVGTSKENINAVWVKNEWSRFEERIEKEHLQGTWFAVFENINANDLPNFLHTQGIDLAKYPAGGYEIEIADSLELKLGKRASETEQLKKQLEDIKKQQTPKTKKQKIISIVAIALALIVAIASTFIIVKNVGGGKGNQIKYTNPEEYLMLVTDGNQYFVTGVKDTAITSAEIPNTYNNLPVTTIKESAFGGCEALKSITIGENVTTIKSLAFSGCVSLQSLTLENNITTIESEAFSGCVNLEEIYFNSSNLTEITKDSNVFYNAGANKELALTFGEDITTVPKYLFENSKIKTIEFSNNIVTIEQEAFSNCSSLQSITLGENVTTIKSLAFSGCVSLQSLTLENNITTIESEAFSGCVNLEEIYFNSSNLTELTKDSNVFYNAGANKELALTFGEDITTVPKFLFENSKIKTIEFSNNIVGIEQGAFSNCSSLQSVTLGKNVATIKSLAFSGCVSLQSLTLENNITTIGQGAFSNCSSLQSVIIGQNVVTIEQEAFSGCNNLKKVYNKSALNIKRYSDNFGNITSNCTNLYNWSSQLNDYQEDFGELRFDNVYANVGIVEGVILEPKFTYLDKAEEITYSFEGNNISITNGIVKALVDNTETIVTAKTAHHTTTFVVDTACFNIQFNGNGYIITSFINKNATNYFIGATYLGKPIIGIGNNAFNGCTNLNTITFDENCQVISIGNYAFNGCSKLSSIKIPKSVTSIGNKAFNDCTNLTSITFDENSQITSIGDYAFSGCTKLSSIEIPKSVTSIGKYAFYGCNNLSRVYFKDTSGWFNTASATQTSGGVLDVSSASQNAIYMKGDGLRFYYKKNQG